MKQDNLKARLFITDAVSKRGPIRLAGAAALMRPIPPEAGHYRDKSAHPMDARMHPKGVRGPCCVR